MRQYDSNPVKRNMDKIHKPAVHRSKKKELKLGYSKNSKYF